MIIHMELNCRVVLVEGTESKALLALSSPLLPCMTVENVLTGVVRDHCHTVRAVFYLSSLKAERVKALIMIMPNFVMVAVSNCRK